jgi:16S rRNA (adenine1518-N6/adenine1519-N6)-dimethyltransferase
MAGWRAGRLATEARIAFDVPPQAFTPPPKVTSSVVHIEPRAEPLPATPPRSRASPRPPSASAARCCARA